MKDDEGKKVIDQEQPADDDDDDNDGDAKEIVIEEERREETDEPVVPTTYCSHFRNTEAHPFYIRYGLPLFLVCSLAFLTVAHVGSGVSAEYILLRDGEIQEQRELLVASIFSSIRELWENGSYPLAILIVLTSVMWPYLNLLMSLYAWFAPYKRPRRWEFMIEVVDGLGKWSFVDIVVLVEIMVAFRYVFVFILKYWCTILGLVDSKILTMTKMILMSSFSFVRLQGLPLY